MRNHLVTLLFLVALRSSPAVSATIELASQPLPPCTRIQWREQRVLGFVVTKIPQTQFAEQRHILTADLRGDGLDTAELAPIVTSCAKSSAAEIGLGVLFAAPKENADFFERLMNACTAKQLRTANLPTSRIKVLQTSLATDTKCDVWK